MLIVWSDLNRDRRTIVRYLRGFTEEFYESRSISNPITTTMTIANGTFSETSKIRLNSTNIDLREMPILEESENSHSNSDNRNGDAK